MDADNKSSNESKKPRRKDDSTKPELDDALAGYVDGADEQDNDDLSHQMKLSQDKTAETLSRREKEDHKSDVLPTVKKPRASHFNATSLKIGNWEVKSRNKGDLVGKFYFVKRRLVWEVVDGSLMNKIEISWDNITGLKATLSENGPETLDVVLARRPLFFRKTPSQPGRSASWEKTSDFTGRQATDCRQHFLQCAPRLLKNHFEKLIQCDPHLKLLSRQLPMVLDNPYFESNDESENAVDLKTNVNKLDSVSTPSELNSQGTPLPASELGVTEEVAGNRTERLQLLDQIKLPGFDPSMSRSDLVNHTGQGISEQMTTVNPGLSIHEAEVLEGISQFLFSDSEGSSDVDEDSLMSTFDSFSSVLQSGPSTTNLQLKEDNSLMDMSEPHGESEARNECQESSSTSRKDSEEG